MADISTEDSVTRRIPHSNSLNDEKFLATYADDQTVEVAEDLNFLETFMAKHKTQILILGAIILTVLAHVYLALCILWNPAGYHAENSKSEQAINRPVHSYGSTESQRSIILAYSHVGMSTKNIVERRYRPVIEKQGEYIEKLTEVLVFICIGWAVAAYYGPIVYIENKWSIFSRSGTPIYNRAAIVWNVKVVPYLTFGIVFVAFFSYIVYDAWEEKTRLISIGGLFIHILVCVIFSTNPSKIKWRPVVWGIGMQFAMGMLVLRWETGHIAFSFFSDQTVAFLDYAQNGTRFVYGFLADPSGLPPHDIHQHNKTHLGAVFAFGALQTVIYFGAVVSLLYHWGIIQFILIKVAYVMQWTLGTTAAESLNAAACIFLGQTEAALLIRPCLATMTESEIHAVMTAGYACIAGSLFAAYISFGACPDYLLSASVMSAPASLAVAKLLMPETEKSQQADMASMKFPRLENNVLEAISNGAVIAVGYVAAIIANLVVIMGLLAFVDATFGWFGGMVGYPQLTFEEITGYVFFPLAFVMGSSEANTTAGVVHDTKLVAQLMGTKTIVNEFVAYQKLGCLVKHGEISRRARMIATYALCGFSNIGSIGIQLGIMSGMCPEKSAVFARVAVRGLLAGSMACFMTACVAGILVPGGTLAECPAMC